MKLKIKNVQRPFLFDPSPKFEGWSRQQYLAAGIPEVEPMLCKEFDPKYIKKHPGEWVAQDKLDGHRATCIYTKDGFRFFSRRISKESGWYAENTDRVPHLRDAKINLPIGTIFDGELLFDYPCTSKDVQRVTGALPQNALAFQQQNGFLFYNAFDLIAFGAFPMVENYRDRLFFLNDINLPYGFKKVNTYYWKEDYGENFTELLKSLWEQGKEGLVLKNLDSTYEQGKRSPNWLKRKEINTYDVVICGYQEPTRLYDGKDPERWQYWENEDTHELVKCIGNPAKVISSEAEKQFVPVTKPYAMGWIGAIEFGLYRDGELVKIGEAKGITDADQDYIKKYREKLLGTVIEVKAQGIIDQAIKSLRHPRFKQFRPDKNAEECQWEGFGE